jgi:hypothetical protein
LAALLALTPILYEKHLTPLLLATIFQSLGPLALAACLLCMALYADFYAMASMFVLYHALYELVCCIVL